MRTSKLVPVGLAAAIVIAAGALITQHNELVVQAEQLTATSYQLETQAAQLRAQTERLQAQTGQLSAVDVEQDRLASQAVLPAVVVSAFARGKVGRAPPRDYTANMR